MTAPEHDSADVDAALTAADVAFASFRRSSGDERARLLEAIADEILELGDGLIGTADAETALGAVRLTGERGRTVNQLRLFAQLAREGSWIDARIDRGDRDRKPAPRPDLRRALVPLGPVVVFAASNFPLAFSVAGGDTASALAAGCPVVVKAHPAHPRTSELVAAAVRAALRKTGHPAGVFALLHGRQHELGLSLVRHPLTRAVGFTGSLRAGRALFDAAAARPAPIPVYAEMGSVNPVFVLPGALAERAAAVAAAIADSATLGAGQFCTKPGLVFVAAERGRAEEEAALAAFTRELAARITSKPPAVMLYPELCARYQDGLFAWAATPGVSKLAEAPMPADAPIKGQASAWLVGLDDWLAAPSLREELFGPVTLVVHVPVAADLLRAAAALDGQLTATLQGTPIDFAGAGPLLAVLEHKVGRLVFNGVPTGVEVAHAMNHGGPYPATSDVRSTSVGTAAVLRFARPLCWQDAPESALPIELRDRNERGLLRLVDGRPTRDDL